jgi:hypothetical protein
MRVVLSFEARQEFDEAERYYEREFEGLGKRSRVEVRTGIRRIRNWPLSYPASEAISGV